MPTYIYICSQCVSDETVIHSINSDPEVKCSFCGNVMDRKPQVAAVTFNGSGWGKDA